MIFSTCMKCYFDINVISIEHRPSNIGGRMGELDKASFGDRGTSWSEFDSPGEHSCSHIRALPLHIQLHLFLPCTAHIRTPRGTKMMVLPSLSSTQTTPNNIYIAHENAQNRKQYTVSRCKKVIYHWRPDVCNIADAPNSTNTNTNSDVRLLSIN
jgi:hypothetical protein